MSVEAQSGPILDLGGGPASFFATLFPRPERIISVDIDYNLVCQAKQEQPGLYAIVADGRRLPLADSSVSVTICNSVIEHVDDADALAAEIRRASQSYFLQTPNRDFPLETHSFIAIPFYNSIPWAGLRRLLCRMFGANFQYVTDVHYLSEQRLGHLFPGATITCEKALGLKKSFYVYYLDERAQ
jgi:SAM-dependent methyltransferase